MNVCLEEAAKAIDSQQSKVTTGQVAGLVFCRGALLMTWCRSCAIHTHNYLFCCLQVSPTARQVRHLAADGSLVATGMANTISLQLAGGWLPLEDVSGMYS